MSHILNYVAILMLILPVRNMLMIRTVSVFLCQTKINDVDLIKLPAKTNYIQQTNSTITEKVQIAIEGPDWHVVPSP